MSPAASRDDLERFDGHDPLAGFLGRDEDFAPNDLEVEGLVSRLDARLDSLDTPRVQRMPWLRHLAAAAVITLLLGATMIGYLGNGSRIGDPVSAQLDVLTLSAAENGLLSFLSDAELPLFEDTDVDLLLLEYTSGTGGEAAALLQDQLTDEELEYLSKNFDVGDML